MHPALEHFHPLIQNWFQNRVGRPTDAQCQTWPAVAVGAHVLLTAPTGSGKTLSAFLWALHQLITRTWQNGNLRVLYISPLKALNNDIRINLLQPLSELRQVFQDAGEPFPEIHVMTRSGDTPPSERQRIQRRPPEILITTPESLNIMLTTARNAAMFESVRTVILDEVHAVAGNKRGTHLITAVERLVPIAGEFQRLALSATVQPLELIAEYLGGYRLLNPGEPESDAYEPRPVRILRSEAHKEYTIEVRQPIDINPHDPDSYWNELIKEIKQLISRNRSTLVFANSRRFTEKIARLLNEGEAHPIALAHHGSLSREIRLAVEQRLKAGELPAIVATSSLELGIDIGSVDMVVLIQTPQSVNSTLQRLGRAGHGVGQISRGVIYPTHAMDILDAAIMTHLALQRDIETVDPPRGALDVLAQIIVSMVCQALPGTIRTDEVYRQLRCSYSYHKLSRTQFDLVIGMLTGRYADRPIRELRPRLAHDRIRGTLQARRGAERLLYLAGGTIPDRGYFNLRLLSNNARIGELDEEFVWERSIGETFSLGNHHWRILNITHNDVLVEAGNPAHAILPFWRAETLDRSFHFQEKLGVFLEQNQNRLSKPDFLNNLTEEYKVDRSTAETLITFLKAQKEATNRDLPHRHHLVIEHFMDALNRDDRKQVILHTLWGGRVNRPYSLALRAAWRKQFGYKIPVVADDNAVLIILPHDFSADELLRLVSPDEIEDLLKLELESSGHFGARFRENAGRALLLPPPGFNKRQPLWFNRMRAGKLMEAVQSTGDFPVLLETWRNCLHDDFELERLRELLTEIHNGRITVSECATRSASPFAANLIWEETNYYMYRDDTPEGERKSSLDSGLLADVIFQNNRRLRVSTVALNDFLARRQRTAPGYAPADALECVEWIKERGLLPFTEWRQLWQAIQRDHPDAEVRIDDPLIQNSLCAIHPEHAIQPLVMAIQDLSAFADTCRYDLETLSPIALRHPDEEHTSACVNTVKLIALAQSVPPPLTSESVAALFTRVLRFYGPVAPEFTRELLGVPAHSANTALEQLLEERTILSGPLLECDERTRICDADNLEYLLRLTRRHARAEHHLDPRPLRELPLFLATYQDFPDLKNSTNSNATASDVEFTHHSEPQELRRHIQKLMGYPAPVELWEQEILPARFSTYRTHMLDSILEEGEILWLGCGPKQVLFCFEADLEMFQPGGSSRTDSTVRPGSDNNPKKESRELPDLNKEAAQLFDHPRARYRFSDLLQFTHLAPQELNARLWELSWAGLIVADGMAALRQGIRNRFRKDSNENPRSSLRGRLSSRTGAHPGLWRRLEPTTLEDVSSDALDQEDLNRDRLRVLLDRYGILFRELLMRELPHMRWKQLFRSLRLMEFSGEVFGGYYFEDIPGLQYISARAFRILRGGLKADSIYWMNACDPIFPGGLPGLRFSGPVPRRIATNHVVYHGSQIVLVSHRHGRRLVFSDGIEPGHKNISIYLRLFHRLLERDFAPPQRIQVESINDVPALQSEYEADLLAVGFERDYRYLTLRRGGSGT